MASSLVEYGDSEYPIVVSEVNDVLDSIEFNSFEERCLCEAIITEMDKAIADTISDEKVANIPFIGCVRRNPIRKAINDNKEKLKVIRKGITKEQYKDHVRCILNDAREKVEKEDARKRFEKTFRNKNKKKYERYFINYGRAYAEAFIKALTWLEEVPFDIEVEEAFENLRNS